MNGLWAPCLAIFALTLVGAAVPWFVPGRRFIHQLVALATGGFLGVVFLHLLPEVGRIETGDQHGFPLIWLWVLIGVVGLFLLEFLVFDRGAEHSHGHDDARHRAVGIASFCGLSVHAFLTGLAWSAARELPELERPLLFSIFSHKVVEGFSLAAIFLLARLSKATSWVLLTVFSAVTPFGALLGAALVTHLPEPTVHVLTAFAAGTFLYVALFDLLPEVFHHREQVVSKVLLLIAGILLGALLHAFEH